MGRPFFDSTPWGDDVTSEKWQAAKAARRARREDDPRIQRRKRQVEIQRRQAEAELEEKTHRATRTAAIDKLIKAMET